jgi:hypothetical protein
MYLFPEDKRFIFFTRDGVDIRDENGEAKSLSVQSANIRQSDAEATRSTPKVSFLVGRSYPWDLPRGSSSSGKACFRKPINLLPIEPGDAIWLFNRFLDHEYPQGGELDPATPALHPDVDSVWITEEAALPPSSPKITLDRINRGSTRPGKL